MGTIYLAQDTRFSTRNCAVKEMLDTFTSPIERADAVRRFEHESDILAALQHPNIISVFDRFTEGQRHYLVMPFIKGRSLEEHLVELGGYASEAKVIEWTLCICDVLEYLHSQQPPIIYRDLKPSNIMVTDTGRLILIDFGIARNFVPRAQGTMIGTPGYAPPEQWQGMAEPRSDLYSLGATMHHLLTGIDPRSRPPFVFDPVRNIKPALSSSIEQIIDKLLQMRADQRYPNTTALKQALLNVTRSVQPVIVPPTPQPKPSVIQPKPQPRLSLSTIHFEELSEGLSIEEALEAFMDGCNKNRDRLFAPRSWVNPRLSDLRKLLSDPITAEQAAALREAALKKRNLDTVIDWLRHRPMTWKQYQDMLTEQRAEEEQRLARERKREEQERAALRRDFARVAEQPLSHVTGSDVLSAFYHAWARCEMPPGYHLPGGGMGDMVLEEIRDKFANHFVAGLRGVLPGDRNVQNLSGQAAQLSNMFDRIWAGLPQGERRPIAVRIWREYLLPATCTQWGIKPGDAENLLNLKEFLYVRQLPSRTGLRQEYEYEWLAE
jgi:serine/threonine protein kinase